MDANLLGVEKQLKRLYLLSIGPNGVCDRGGMRGCFAGNGVRTERLAVIYQQSIQGEIKTAKKTLSLQICILIIGEALAAGPTSQTCGKGVEGEGDRQKGGFRRDASLKKETI